MKFFEKIKLVFKQPGILIRYRSFGLRKLYFNLSKYLHLKTYLSRRKNINYQCNLYNQGYEKIGIETLNKNNLNINSVIIEIEEKIKDLDYSNQSSHLKSIKISEIFDTNSNVFNFLTSDYLINIVSEYLGCVPILTYSSVWYSRNDEIIDNSSQEYHLDHEDYKQVKGFLYLEDIDETNGAMNLFTNTNSKKVIQQLDYKTSPEKKRVKDEFFSKYENEKIICKGEKGTLYLVDTSNCFHCGARKSPKSRLLLSFQFITPWANYLNWNWKKSKIIGNNIWNIKKINDNQKKIIGLE